jgi:small subunit ribosomal protein S6e
MVELRICVGDVKKGKTYQKVITDKEVDSFKGLKLGDKIKGEHFGMSGYELEITGGSDQCGFPMRKGIESDRRVKIYASGGVGIKKKTKGKLSRKNVAGAIISSKTTQINLKVLEYGKKTVAECFVIEEKAKEEPKTEVPKEEPKKEEVKEEKKAEENVPQKSEN